MWLSTMRRQDISVKLCACYGAPHNRRERYCRAVSNSMAYLRGTSVFGVDFCPGLGIGFDCV